MSKVKISNKLTRISDRLDIKTNRIVNRVIKTPDGRLEKGDLVRANEALKEEKTQ